MEINATSRAVSRVGFSQPFDIRGRVMEGSPAAFPAELQIGRIARIDTIPLGNRQGGRGAGRFQMPSFIFDTEGFDMMQLPKGNGGLAGIFFGLFSAEMSADPASHTF